MFLSPDSLLVRLAEQPVEVQLFWRSLLQGLGLAFYTGWRFQGNWGRQLRQVGNASWFIILGFLCSSSFFVLAIQHAQVGHVLLLLNTAPVVAGLLSWVVLRETPTRLTWILIGMSLLGSSLIVQDSGSLSDSSGSTAFGLLMALGCAVATSTNFLAARTKAPLDVTPVLVPACLLLCLGSALFGGAVLPPWESFRWLLLLGGVCLPMAYIGIQSGPRYISAPETSLILLLESVIGILLAWWFLEEIPGFYGWLGGALVLGSLTVKGWWEWSQTA